MKVLSSIAALVALASATAINVDKRDSPLSVKLEAAGNSEVKVTVTNTGAKALNLLAKGTFLDEENPVQKVKVFSANAEVPFEGIKLRLLTTGLQESAFTALEAGASKTITVDTAALHKVEEGGNFDVFASGIIPYAEAGSTELTGSLSYASNKLSLTIDGAQASKVAKALTKRTTIGSDCTGSKLTAVRTALSNCQRLANSAASAARSGTKMSTYFKSTSSSVKSSVAARLTAVASDCGGGSRTQTHCTDTYSGCSSNVLAYTLPSANYIVYCNLFFTDLPALASTCHGQDQATTALHEETHAPGVYSPGTDDLAYGYSAAIQLSSSQAVNNADSYALYANAIYLNC
ncbi:neutral protease 2-like protein [Delitschia confertaspora ATCC 74209]|uniref:Neutral protease 2 n=1 Tax=Delitschia confertaspora ATCC 74209 TaxID=1513339 RepID=A0A9P4MSI0_9PLEO|nr:neutral protease 2-like protein [Delitschia confertaspora ATCC 74209]